jgi:AraC-like DNA-binding protein
MSLEITGREPGNHVRVLSHFRRIAMFRTAKFSVEGVTALPQPGTAAAAEYIKVLFTTNGQIRIWQNGAPLKLDAGSWTLYDPSQPYRIDSVGRYDCIALVMPTSSVPSIRGSITSAALTAYPTQGNMLMALQALSLCLGDDIDVVPSEEKATASAIAALLESGIKRFAGVLTKDDAEDRAEVLLSKVKAEIQARASDPDFTVESLADTLRISRRTLYNILKTKALTPYQAILEYRLEASSQVLIDPAHRHKRVTNVALESGFPDASHFSRVFKRRFGVTPSVYRSGVTDMSGI